MTTIEGPNGGDPVGAILGTLRENKKELTSEAPDLWYQESREWLTEAANRRTQLGEEHGRQGRAMHGLAAILEGFIPPKWRGTKERWEWVVDHEGAVFQEWGARPHEIRAKKAEVLAFDWPDSPQDVKEQFSYTEDDLVFFESVQHPGVPAIGFMRYGRDRAKDLLESKGYDTEEFESRGESA